jgi:hypothetical protein
VWPPEDVAASLVTDGEEDEEEQAATRAPRGRRAVLRMEGL